MNELPGKACVSGVHEEENRCVESNRLRRQSADGQAVESGSNDMENKCAKLNHNRRGVASVE